MYHNIIGKYLFNKFSLFSKRKKLEKLRSMWSKPIDRFRNYNLISSYLELCGKNEVETVDDKTWTDLDFNNIFAIMDRNISGIGRQYLYKQLHSYVSDKDKLDDQLRLYELFRKDDSIKYKIQLILQKLSSDENYFIINLLLGEQPVIPRYPFLIYTLSYMSLLMIPAALYSGPFFFGILFMSALNLIITKIYSNKIYESFIGFSGLSRMISAAFRLSTLKEDLPSEQLKLIRKHKDILTEINKKIGYLVLDKTNLDSLSQSVIEYLNMFCLFDLVAYTKSAVKMYKYKNELLEVFEAIGSLDSAISTSSFLDSLPFYSKAGISDTNSINITDVYHPLIEKPVPNSIEDLRKSALITGSNMAGKTTFIRCIGVNFILARTMGFVCARNAVIPDLIVKTSIRIEDSIQKSKSYYLTEVEEIRKFIALCGISNKYLFIIDEIFRGTNTIERLGISAAVLKELNKKNTVLVTTHDIELQELLDNEFQMFHFSEHISDENLYFDYKIKEGPCYSGNAIRLLSIAGYPQKVVSEAGEISAKLYKLADEN